MGEDTMKIINILIKITGATSLIYVLPKINNITIQNGTRTVIFPLWIASLISAMILIITFLDIIDIDSITCRIGKWEKKLWKAIKEYDNQEWKKIKNRKERKEKKIEIKTEIFRLTTMGIAFVLAIIAVLIMMTK